MEGTFCGGFKREEPEKTADEVEIEESIGRDAD